MTMNTYTISITRNDQDSDQVVLFDNREEVASTPDQAMWQAFGVMVQDSSAYLVKEAKLLQSRDRHFNATMGGTLRVEVTHRVGCRKDATLLFHVESIEVDRSEREVMELPPIEITRDSFIVIDKHEHWGESPTGAGKILLSNGMTFGYCYASDGEVTGYCTKVNGQGITKLNGWYRTKDPETAAMIAIDRIRRGNLS